MEQQIMIKELEREIAVQKELIDRLYIRINNLQNLLSSVQIENGRNAVINQNVVQQYEQNLLELQNSFSWKITMPLRCIRLFVGRIVRKVLYR